MKLLIPLLGLASTIAATATAYYFLADYAKSVKIGAAVASLCMILSLCFRHFEIKRADGRSEAEALIDELGASGLLRMADSNFRRGLVFATLPPLCAVVAYWATSMSALFAVTFVLAALSLPTGLILMVAGRRYRKQALASRAAGAQGQIS